MRQFRIHKVSNKGLVAFATLLAFLPFQNCGQNYSVTTKAPDQNSTQEISGTSPGTPSNPGNPGGGGENNPPGNPGTCTLVQVTSPVKILFVVDASGSNRIATKDNGTFPYDKDSTTCPTGASNCAPASDPQKTFRGGSIEAFYNENYSRSNISWGFHLFQESSAKSLIGTSGNSKLGNALEMAQALSSFRTTEQDGGGTPYLAGLSLALETIHNDVDLSNSDVAYVVVFLSDGYPTDHSVNSQILNDKVKSILDLAPGRINLGAVYYGTVNDPAAASVLQGMAAAGKGAFLNINTDNDQAFDINQVVREVPSGDCETSSP
jgi:hypothetical protein